MLLKEGYVYHVYDEYFDKVKDDHLMKNKENGKNRPAFLCIEDKNAKGLYWMVPMSSKTEKYQEIYNKQAKKYGKCITIVMGEFDGKKSAFLLQNMFPVTKKYLSHIHTKNGNPVPVKHSISKKVHSNLQILRNMTNRGKKVVFPNVLEIERKMKDELSFEKKKREVRFSVEEADRAIAAKLKQESEKEMEV